MVDATLVTIHGFWSSPATWDRLDAIWNADEQLRGLRIHPFRYPSPKRPLLPLSMKRVPDYDDLAQTLATEYRIGLAEASNVAIVTHSQGGLILQRFLAWMLDQGRGRELVRIRSIVMLACPNGGSEYLRSIRRVLWFGHHPQGGSLRVLDRRVADTQRTVLDRIVNATGVDDRQCRIPFHVYAGDSDKIVTAASAQGAFPQVGTLPGDHSSILDPDVPGNRTAGTVKQHLLDDLAAGPPEPAAAEKPTRGRPVAQWDPVELGVHQVIGGGPMPAYVRRPHDELLRAVLDPAVPASRLVVVRGGSSTGKTRAAYEAVADRLADWQLDYPLDPGALAERLEAGIPARTVLWLGELRQYADADGGAAVLGRLADLLAGEGHLVITTMWPEQWNTYTAAARAGPGAADPAGTAGRLLERLPELTGSDPARIDPARGGVIDVPARVHRRRPGRRGRAPATRCWRTRPRRPPSAGQAGQVTQYLAGVPDLLDRYAGPGGDPYGQAVITAAMDATRLGHASPLPAALLQEAAVGYLTDPQRTKDIATWRDTALAWAAAELRGAVRALQPVPPPARHRRRRLPGRRLPRPARPPHPPGPARPALPVGRPHHPRRHAPAT